MGDFFILPVAGDLSLPKISGPFCQATKTLFNEKENFRLAAFNSNVTPPRN